MGRRLGLVGLVGAWVLRAVSPLAAAGPSGDLPKGAAALQQPSFICGEAPVVGRPGEVAPPGLVYELQLGLRLLSLFPHPLDGRYDERTRQAVQRFQSMEGLEADGVAGPRTWAALARRFEQQLAEAIRAQRVEAGAEPAFEAPPLHPDVQPGGYWIVVDTRRLRLVLYRDGQVVHRWPVAVGKPGTPTPVGEWRVVHKSRDWGGGFGTRWLGLDVPWGIYGIHGTNKPWSIGARASAGCIRMFNADVERLWELVPLGTPVTVVGIEPEAHWDQAIAAGASGWNVPLLQWSLRRAGFDPGRADGRVGERTMAAIREAQRVLGLAPVPMATPELFRALGLRRAR